MEMMSFGVPVISYAGDYTTYHAKIWDLESIAEQMEKLWKAMNKEGSTVKQQTLQYARDNFDREKEVSKYVELYKKVLGTKDA
jgi:glycosyltransferase involved in cell wall biosynthesis